MKRSNLVRIDNAFLPIYWLTKQLKSIAPRRNSDHNQVVILKFFGVGSMTRIATVLRDSNFEKRAIFLTLKRNKAIVDLLGLNAIYINDKNPFVLAFSAMQRVFTVWNLRKTQVVDMERSSNIAGMYGLILSIRKKHAQFELEGANVNTRNRRTIALRGKAATVAIAELLELDQIAAAHVPVVEKPIKKIVININAGEYLPERKFPKEKWLELIKELAGCFPKATFYFSGLENEREDVLTFCERLSPFLEESRCVVLAGQQNLKSFVEFLQTSDLFLTNDSGPLHLAYHFNIRTVALWGPTSSYLVGYSDSSRMLNLTHQLGCSPCFVSPKSDVAKSCGGELSCFQEMELTWMVSKIKAFVASENQ